MSNPQNPDSKKAPSPPQGSASPQRPKQAGGGPREVGTTFAVLPQFEGADLMPQTSGKLLAALKIQVSQLAIEQAGSGIRHEDGNYVVLPNTLRSAWMAKVNHAVLGPLKFLVGQTRSTWVLVYDQPHERLYEDPRFMPVELKRRDVTRTPKGKQVYVSRIERADLDRINAIAAQDAGERPASTSLAPAEDAGAFHAEAVLARLRQATLLRCSAPGFDPVAFFGTVQFMTPTQAGSGNYYYLEAGDPEAPLTCELHVGADPELREGTYAHRAVLSHGDEQSYLYLDIRY